MPATKSNGFMRVATIFESDPNVNPKEVVGISGVALTTLGRWLKQLKHRQEVFNQKPDFDQEGRFTHWRSKEG